MPFPFRARGRCRTQKSQGFTPTLRAMQTAEAGREDQVCAMPETSRAWVYARVPSRRVEEKSDSRTNRAMC